MFIVINRKEEEKIGTQRYAQRHGKYNYEIYLEIRKNRKKDNSLWHNPKFEGKLWKKVQPGNDQNIFDETRKKGFIRLKWEGRYSYISSLVEEKAYQKKQLENMKEFWFDDSLSDMICAFTETISQEEAEELKDLVDKLRD